MLKLIVTSYLALLVAVAHAHGAVVAAYLSNGRPISVLAGRLFCGHSTVPYTETSDIGLLAQQQALRLAAVTTRAGLVLHQVQSAYRADSNAGSSASVTGPIHGGYPGGDSSTFGLLADWAPQHPGGRIVAVSACCAGESSWGNAVEHIRLLTADGREVGPSSSRCSVPQPWEPVPAGYVVGGLVTCSKPEGRPQDTWVHQLAYVFVGSPSSVDVQESPGGGPVRGYQDVYEDGGDVLGYYEYEYEYTALEAYMLGKQHKSNTLPQTRTSADPGAAATDDTTAS